MSKAERKEQEINDKTDLHPFKFRNGVTNLPVAAKIFNRHLNCDITLPFGNDFLYCRKMIYLFKNEPFLSRMEKKAIRKRANSYHFLAISVENTKTLQELTSSAKD